MRIRNNMADEMSFVEEEKEMEIDSGLKDTSDSIVPKVKTSKLKQAFGRARLFEIRRLVRRIKQLSLKKGTEQQLQKNKRKISRLERQLELLKDLHYDTFIESVDAEDDKKGSTQEEESDDNAKAVAISKILKIVNQDIEKREISRQNVKYAKKSKRSLTIDSLKKKRDYSTKNIALPETVSVSLTNDLDISDSDSEQVVNSRAFSMDSVFVGSLKDGRQKRGNGKKRKENKKTENRVGQRKRREQWGKLYGSKANHFKTVEKKQGSLNQKNRKFDGKKRRDGVPKKSRDTSVLHPSWEASKSKRKQESIVAFQGSKITFDD
ncbi:hypothetical protein QZH41_002545 [Actinostola sp. cb2023]|nr:hypothetical protein QZH41_002545 [Actinostola sp. cb2023]